MHRHTSATKGPRAQDALVNYFSWPNPALESSGSGSGGRNTRVVVSRGGSGVRGGGSDSGDSESRAQPLVDDDVTIDRFVCRIAIRCTLSLQRRVSIRRELTCYP